MNHRSPLVLVASIVLSLVFALYAAWERNWMATVAWSCLLFEELKSMVESLRP
jgi:hypothetical protein